jgi:malate dehydrogenase (oxaloacetate-decarboxylating)(NADP+)
MPFVYTPTVGEACQKWSHITRSTPRGVYLSIKDKGNIRAILEQQPNKNIKVLLQ